MPIDEVERALEKTRLSNTECSLLGLLQSPCNAASAVREILDRISDDVEDNALNMALVWRYAKEYEVWKSCENPSWRTEDAFLNSLSAYQTARICIQLGTSTDAVRHGKINIIQRNWGSGWYDDACARSLLPQGERGAASLSKRILSLIAKMSHMIDLEGALDLWEKAIQDRIAVGTRRLLGWRAATTSHLLTSDFESIVLDLGGDVVSASRPQESQNEEETLELMSSASGSSLSPFGIASQPTGPKVKTPGPTKSRTTKFEPRRASQAIIKKKIDDSRQQHQVKGRNTALLGVESTRSKRTQCSPSANLGDTSREKRARLRRNREGQAAPSSLPYHRRLEGPAVADVDQINVVLSAEKTTRAAEPAKSSSPNYMEDTGKATRSETCVVCRGTCAICKVPSGIDIKAREYLVRTAHSAVELEQTCPSATLLKWISPLRYCSRSEGTLQGSGDLCVLSAKDFASQTGDGCLLAKPCLVPAEDDKSSKWSPARYANLLESRFFDLEVDVRWHGEPTPTRHKIKEMADLCRAPTASCLKNPPNMLNLPALTKPAVPEYLQTDRFQLLEDVITRCKGDATKHLGKQLHLSAFDVGSCIAFNILGWPGAFSGAHVDSNGCTWIRNLFGRKLWMFVPEALMSPEDWRQFAHDGDEWDPRDKARAVILNPGDVFIMRAGLVHGVLTLDHAGPCLMEGGFFFDSLDLVHTLQTYHKLGKNQSMSNEPMAYQLEQILSNLSQVVKEKPNLYFQNTDDHATFQRWMEAVRSLGCDCLECDSDCTCREEGRRCTPLCHAHAFNLTETKACMSEERSLIDSDDDLDQYIP